MFDCVKSREIGPKFRFQSSKVNQKKAWSTFALHGMNIEYMSFLLRSTCRNLFAKLGVLMSLTSEVLTWNMGTGFFFGTSAGNDDELQFLILWTWNYVSSLKVSDSLRNKTHEQWPLLLQLSALLCSAALFMEHGQFKSKEKLSQLQFAKKMEK